MFGRSLLLTVLAAGLLGSGTAAASPATLPVPYELPDTVALELENPGGSAPGSNDPNCRPTPDKPNPVVLVHNTSGNRQVAWQTFSPLLANAGYCVFAPTFGAFPGPWPVSALGGMAPLEPSTHQLSAFVDEVLAQTGAEKVDIVGHSQGTLVAAKWIGDGGAGKVDRLVSLAPLWDGTTIVTSDGVMRDFEYATCPACADMLPGSQFLEDLAATGRFVESVEYTNILTAHDDVVQPYTSGLGDDPNVTDIVLQDVCASAKTTHLEMLADRLTAELVLSTLDETVPTPTGCVD
ncbi:triacylglycerol lipase [Rhodococcus rhodochrous J45]|uniref:Triacylglycerol lipase n=1 Tax=Rhodococcus rhodochrous J45 TaxID=935266 RepID=A0A562E1M8_RHORH|nr:alpha/beta fold hydrolase [Rhodococcus rhodochrous]TWH15693.1 triacylglycerol lipase [Rhodococcus rhodochrous J45]